MNEFEAQKYIRYVAPVQFEIKQLRAILEAAQAKVAKTHYELEFILMICCCREKNVNGAE